MPFFSGFPIYGAGGGLFSSFNENMTQPNMYGNQFPTPPQSNIGMGYTPPYLMQYMQQFGAPMQQPNMPMQQPNMPMQQPNMPMQQFGMPMQQPNMNYLDQQAAQQYMQQFGGLAQSRQPVVPGGQGFPPPGQMGGPVAQPQPFYPMNQYQSQRSMAPNAALSGAPAQANMVGGSRATLLPPAPPIPLANSPIRTKMAAPVNTANMGDVRKATGVSLADALKKSRAF